MLLTSAIPVYKLYGEHEPWPTPDMVHCETIASRSQLHNWEIKPHQHHGLFQVLHLAGGGAEVRLDGQRQRMLAGQVLAVPPMCVHGFGFTRDSKGHVFTLASPLVQRLGPPAPAAFAAPRILSLGRDAEGVGVALAFDALAREYRRGAAHRERMMEALLAVVLVWLARHTDRPDQNAQPAPSRAERHLEHFYRLIEQAYASQHGVAYYAARIGISAAHLNALCRQARQRSALEVIHERLLLEARRNLIYTSMSVNLISSALGFADPAYFTRFFKRATGLAPREFRRQAREAFG